MPTEAIGSEGAHRNWRIQHPVAAGYPEEPHHQDPTAAARTTPTPSEDRATTKLSHGRPGQGKVARARSGPLRRSGERKHTPR